MGGNQYFKLICKQLLIFQSVPKGSQYQGWGHLNAVLSRVLSNEEAIF